jgi:hypothetical protein
MTVRAVRESGVRTDTRREDGSGLHWTLRLACLASPAMESVRAITRRPLGSAHPKLQRSCIGLRRLRGCRGDGAPVSSASDLAIQVSGAEYRRITQGFVLAAVTALHAASPEAVFHISGQGYWGPAHLRLAHSCTGSNLVSRALKGVSRPLPPQPLRLYATLSNVDADPELG